MAYEVAGQRITLICQAAITERYVAVKVVGENTIAPATAGDTCIGFLQVPCKAGEGGPVQINGVTFGVASAAIPAGSGVVPAAAGRIEAGTTDVVGIALTAANAAGDVIAVLQRTN